MRWSSNSHSPHMHSAFKFCVAEAHCHMYKRPLGGKNIERAKGTLEGALGTSLTADEDDDEDDDDERNVA